MFTATADLTQFRAGIRALQSTVNATSRQIVEKEMGELIKTLINITPPSGDDKVEEAKKSIHNDISRNFEILGKGRDYEAVTQKAGKGGIKWYASNSRYLFGAGADKDMTKASQKELLNVHYRAKDIQGTKRIVTSFVGRKTAQRVAITQRILTKEKSVLALIKRVQKNIGRLKAGWYPAVYEGKIRIGGRNIPKRWVTKHADGARGRYDNLLDIPSKPSFTIYNFAKGVSQNSVDFFVQRAVDIRSKAIFENAKLYTEGRKNLNDYLKGTKIQ